MPDDRHPTDFQQIVPHATRVDAQAGERGLSRARFILEALGTAQSDPDTERLARIEAKLDVLLSGKAERVSTGYRPEDIASAVRTLRAEGKTWDAVADRLNDERLLSPLGAQWSATTIRTYWRRNGLRS